MCRSGMKIVDVGYLRRLLNVGEAVAVHVAVKVSHGGPEACLATVSRQRFSKSEFKRIGRNRMT